MKQYNAIKAKYPGTVLLFRVGDFYETFSEDAIVVSRVLGIVLTKRGNGSATEVELAGFPHHSLDTYLPKLVRAGHRVAVCDQLEDPKQAKGIVKRGVTELVTPGVALSDKILESRESNYLAAVHYGDRRTLGLAMIDVSTGDFFCLSGDLSETLKNLQSLSPAEVLVSRKDLKAFREDFGERFYITRQEDWIFQEAYARETLTGHFHTVNLKAFGIEEDALAVTAAGAVMHYIRDTQQGDPAHISRIYKFENSEYVWLDGFTLRNLEVIHPSHPDGQALVDVIDQTATPMGARLLRKWLLFPLRDFSRIQSRHESVESMLKDSTTRKKLLELLKSSGDLERLTARLGAMKLAPRECMMLRNSLQLIAPLCETLIAFGHPVLAQAAARFEDISAPLALLKNSLADDPPNNLQNGGVIREGLSAELDELRMLSGDSKELLRKMQEREAARTGISSLKVSYNKVFGYYIEITNVHKDKVPADYIRKQTLTNGERYITPELKTFEEKILGAEEKIFALESRLYSDLLMQLQAWLPAIQRNASYVAEVDVLNSFASIALERNYVRPQLHTGDAIDIREGRHPVIETRLSRENPYVPNDVQLNNESQQIIIITGPNMAGKSALLRQTGLIVLLAQAGSFVPATSASIGIVDKIFTRVGASDNLSAGESTFMVEMTETARILNACSPRSLVLLDEIGRGTSTYDGVSIAWSLVEYLHETPDSAAKTLFATHYHELNEISGKMARVKNFNVSVKEVEGRILFLRKLMPGGSEHSFGIHVAEMAGMPKSLVQRANELLGHFEQHKVDARDRAQNVTFSSRTSLQLNMFELKDADTLRLRQILAGVDIDRMTPVEALLKLQEIKRALLEEGQA